MTYAIRLPVNVIYLLFHRLFFVPQNNPMKDISTTNEREIQSTKPFDLNKLKKITKIKGVSLNSMFWAVISSATNKLSKDYDYKHLISLIPIGIKNIPNSVDEVRLCNDPKLLVFKLNRIADADKQMNEIHEQIVGSIDLSALLASDLVAVFLGELLPSSMLRYIFADSQTNLDVSLTNVPGPQTKLKYGKSDLEEIIPVVYGSNFNCFFTALTYNEKVRFTLVMRKELGINQNEYMDQIEREFDNLINNCE